MSKRSPTFQHACIRVTFLHIVPILPPAYVTKKKKKKKTYSFLKILEK